MNYKTLIFFSHNVTISATPHVQTNGNIAPEFSVSHDLDEICNLFRANNPAFLP